MKVEEFLASAHFEPLTKISAFDAEIRLLRSRGVSGQNIAKFLTLNNVPATKNSVNKYFLRHPESYSAPKKRGKRPQRHESGRYAATQKDSTPVPRRDDGSSARQSSGSVGAGNLTANATLRDGERDQQSVVQSRNVHATTVAQLREHVTEKHSVRDPMTESHTPLPARSNESAKDSENTRAFDASGTSDLNDDRGTRERTRLVSVEVEPRVPSKMIYWDPSSPENQEALLLYREGLKAGTIPTGVVTNSERRSNERQEDPDHP